MRSNSQGLNYLRYTQPYEKGNEEVKLTSYVHNRPLNHINILEFSLYKERKSKHL